MVDTYIIRHYDVTGKNCPAQFAGSNNADWQAFKNRIKEGLTPKKTEFAVGDTVSFVGNKHYASANAARGVSCKPGEAKITAISKGSKHPYHAVKTSGGGSTVYGWVNAEDIQEKAVVTTPVVTTTVSSSKIDTVKEVQEWLNRNYSAGLVVDGIYGPMTKAALVKVVQKAVGVTADGIYGSITNNAVSNVYSGCTGELVKALQGLLVCNGYASAYVDGDFGNGTLNAVKAYQKDKNLVIDGVAGKGTFSSLCK